MLCRLVPAFHHFTRAPEESASMNQLIEQPPKMGLEARLDPGVGFFLKAQARRGWPAAGEQSVEEARGMLLQTQADYISKLRVDRISTRRRGFLSAFRLKRLVQSVHLTSKFFKLEKINK